MPHNENNTARQAGFSLLELMIAMAISLFLIAGALTLLMNNKNQYEYSDNQMELQEHARYALDLLVGDLRMAGYRGCVKWVFSDVNFNNPGDLLDTTVFIDGLEQGSLVWSAQPSVEIVNFVQPGTDAITIRKLASKGTPLLANMATPNAILNVQTAPVQNGDIGAIYDCESTNIFRVTGRTNTTVSHAQGGGAPSNLSGVFYRWDITSNSPEIRSYDEQSDYYLANQLTDVFGITSTTFVTRFDAFRYFVSNEVLTGQGPSRELGLWRQYFDGAQFVVEELIPGVENMQILYGLDEADPEGSPTRYVRADEIAPVPAGLTGPQLVAAGGTTPWNQVVSVRLSLLVRSQEEYGSDVDDQTYDINGTPDDATDDVGPFNDRRVRTLVHTIVNIANRQYARGS